MTPVPPESTAHRVRAVLNDWDPIGIEPGGPDGAPLDEYDCMIPGLLRLLRRRATAGEVRDFLREDLTSHFSLDPGLATPQVVARLVQLGR